MKTKRRQTKIADDLLSQGELTAQNLNKVSDLSGLASLIDDLRKYGGLCEEWVKTSRRDVRGMLDLLRHAPRSILVRAWRRSARKVMPRGLAALHDGLCKQLRRYDSLWLPLLTHRGVTLGRDLENMKVRRIEMLSFDTIVRLIEHDEFDRLRRCARPECGKWLFAGQRSDQRYCNTECRKAEFEKKPERKKQKRLNAARSYELNYKGARLDRLQNRKRVARGKGKHAEKGGDHER